MVILLLRLSSTILYHGTVILSTVFEELFSYISSTSPPDAYKSRMKVLTNNLKRILNIKYPEYDYNKKSVELVLTNYTKQFEEKFFEIIK